MSANKNRSNAEFPFQRLHRRSNAWPERLPKKNFRNLPSVLPIEMDRLRGIAFTYFVYVGLVASSLSMFVSSLSRVPL